MKKSLFTPFILLSLVTLLFLASSCESDDKEATEADLIGTWIIDESEVEVEIEGLSLLQFLITTLMISEEEAQAMIDEFTSEIGDINGTITFNEDNTYTLTDEDYSEDGTWELSEDGTELQITEDGEMTTFNIESLSSTSMVFSWEEEEYVDMNGDGTDETLITLVFELWLSKQ